MHPAGLPRKVGERQTQHNRESARLISHSLTGVRFREIHFGQHSPDLSWEDGTLQTNIPLPVHQLRLGWPIHGKWPNCACSLQHGMLTHTLGDTNRRTEGTVPHLPPLGH